MSEAESVSTMPPTRKLKLSFQLFAQIVAAALLVMIGGVIGYRYGQLNRLPNQVPLSNIINGKTPASQSNVDFKVFWEVWSTLDSSYLRQSNLDARTMVDGAISGMTAAIGDPYTVYLPPTQNDRSGEDLAGSFYGVGIELGRIDNSLAVVAPLDGSPAAGAGVQAGDLIIRVKDDLKDIDEDSTRWTLQEAVNNIRGQKGTSVTLTLLRRDRQAEARQEASTPIELSADLDTSDTSHIYGEPFEVEIKRDEIVLESVTLEFVEHDGKRVAHLNISRFGERTPQEFSDAVDQILAQESTLDGVILDMRNNPGGYFDGAILVASAFIENGTVVTQRSSLDSQDYTARGKAVLKNLPVEILVNRGSASASEIVAGALRDQLDAKLIGEKTYGKGTVQDRMALSNGGGLHVTIAEWLLPDGDSIQDTGIPVAIEVEDNPETEQDEVLLRAVEEL